MFKSVTDSQSTLTELMIPSYANFGGKIHGGIIMSLMDKVAYVCAAKHAGNYCITASVDDRKSYVLVFKKVGYHFSICQLFHFASSYVIQPAVKC